MRKFLPFAFLILTVGCGLIVARLSGDTYALIRAVLPMVTHSQGFANLHAFIHVGGLILLSFFAGIFSMLIFICRERKTEDE